ncbi:MAG: hypothetical protein ACR2OC_13150 [Solirubrobacterales bacterium]
MADEDETGKIGPSELIGVEFTIAVAFAILIVLACFFFVGPVVGMIALIVSGLLGGYMVVRMISTAGIED